MQCLFVCFLDFWKTGCNCSWWMGQADVLEVGRFSTTASGAGSVMTTGTHMKPRWCAGNWAVGMPWQPRWRPTLGQGKASFCWMVWTVQEERVFWDSVPMPTGTSVTAVPEKTPLSSAQVTVTSPSKDAHPIIQTASPLIPSAELALVCSISGSVCVHVFVCVFWFFIVYFLFLFFPLWFAFVLFY